MKTMKPVTGRVRLARLRNLLRVMEAVAKKPKAAYDISWWGRVYRTPEEFAAAREIPAEKAPPCATVGCTAGWAGMDPWFRKRGVRFQPRHSFPMVLPPDVMRSVGRNYIFALGAWFGVAEREAQLLFQEGPNSKWRKTAASEIVTYLKRLIAKYERVSR